MKSADKEIETRVTLERLLLARGYTWDQIRQELALSSMQLSRDRETIAIEAMQRVATFNVAVAFEEFKDTLKLSIGEIQQIIDSSEDDRVKLTAIQQKIETARRIIDVAIQIGVWDTAADRQEKFSVESTRRISGSGRDITQNILERLQRSSAATRALEPGFEEEERARTNRRLAQT